MEIDYHEVVPQPATPIPPKVFDPLNYLTVMVYICETFDLSHEQMMGLRLRVEKTFHSQPVTYSRKAAAPLSLNAVAITYGLLIGFGGYEQALSPSTDKVLKLARLHDPFADKGRDGLMDMFRRARASRSVGRR